MRLPLRYPANIIIIININIIIINNNNNSGCSSSSSSSSSSNSSLISRISSRLVVGRVILSKINKSEGKVNIHKLIGTGEHLTRDTKYSTR